MLPFRCRKVYDYHAGRERRDAPPRSEYLQIVASAVRRTSDDKDAEIMYFKLKCPHCEKSLKVSEELAGSKRACPYCKGTIRIPDQLAPEPSTPAEPSFPGINISTSVAAKPGKPKLPGAKPTAEPKAKRTSPIAAGGATDTGDIPLIRSGLFGLAAAVAFLILTFPVRHLGIFQLIWDRGPIPFVTLVLTTWSLAILVLKWRKLKHQREAMLLDVLPTELSREITLDSLDKFQQHIHGLPGDAAQSFLVNRVVRGLEHFRVRKSAAETVTMMESQSDIDANNVASSYTIVKVFIWALPIMGFIGTVIGVSSAVASLAGSLESATDITAVKDSLKDVFGGLGVAFDTTLLALVLSLVVKIPQSALQKSEEDLVTWVDEYCNENLLKRLNDGREGGGLANAGSEPEAFRKVIEASLASHQTELQNWSQKLETIGSQLTSQVADGWTKLHQQMQTRMAEYASKMQQQQERDAAETLKQYEQRLHELTRVASLMQEGLSTLGDRAHQIQQEMAASINGTGQALEGHFSGIERGLLGLNGVLEKLGEQTVVVQQVEQPRRNWFGGGNRRR
ncbi:MAG: hypothetical protein EA424_22745 [Planctomycetaceae bacterium]|nr:MAG: hypothetical protein EA424_22745 [Planctomycetaceae bacterium]